MEFKFNFPLAFRVWSASLLWIFVDVACFEWTIQVISLRFLYFIWFEFASLVLSSKTLNWIRCRSLIVMMFWYFKFGCNIVLLFGALRLYVDNFDTLTSTTTEWNVRITSISKIALFCFDSTFINSLIPPRSATHFPYTILSYCGSLGMVITRCSGLLIFLRVNRGANKMLRPFEIVALKSWTHYKWSSFYIFDE